MRKIIFSLFLLIMLVATSYSAELKAEGLKDVIVDDKDIRFDNIESYTSIGDYGKYEIRDSILGIPFLSMDKVKDVELTYNTNKCSQNCEAVIPITNYKDSALIDDVRFYRILDDGSRVLSNVRNYQFYIKTSEYTEEVNDYEYQCSTTGKLYPNGTAILSCSEVIVGSHIETTPVWEEYEIGTPLATGTYELKLVGEKRPDWVYDWQVQTSGIWTTEWALWGQATPVTDLNINPATSNADNSCAGIKFTALKTIIVTNVSIVSTATGGTCKLFQSDASTLLDSGSFSGLTCNLNAGIWLTAGTDYVIANCNNGGHRYSNGVAAQTGTNLNWSATGCYGNDNNGCTNFVAGQPRDIKNITSLEVPSNVTLLSPANNFGGASSVMNFNATAIVRGGSTLVNMSLWDNSTGTFKLNKTQTRTGTTNNTNFTNSYQAGNYILWGIQACDSDGACGFSENRTFVIDATAPNVSIINVDGYSGSLFGYGYAGKNTTFQTSIIDNLGLLGSCWYQYNNVNTTFNCSYGSFNFTGTKSINIWANDTGGNLGNQSFVWDYAVYQNSISYNSTSFETATEGFAINITTNGTVPTSSINYNGTSYTATVSTSATNFIISKSIDISTTTAINNKSFFFNVTVGNQSYTSPNYNQTINPIYFTICNASISTKYLNISFKNETLSQEKVTANIVSSWNYYLGTGAVNKSYTLTNTTQNPEYVFCLNPQHKTVNVAPSIQYANTESSTRTYNADLLSLTNTTTNVTLWLLPYTAGWQQVSFQVLSAGGTVIPDALVEIERSGYGVIEQRLTDASGVAAFYLNPSVTYTVTVTKSEYTTFSEDITPSQTQYTITLGGSSSSNNNTAYDFGRGVTISSVIPSGIELVNQTSYTFGYTIASTYWSLSSYGFNVTDQDGHVVGSASGSTSSGSSISTSINTQLNDTFTMNYYYYIGGNLTSGTLRVWIISNSGDNSYSIFNFVERFKSYTNNTADADGLFGLTFNSEAGNFSLAIIIFLIIFVMTGIFSYKYGINGTTGIIFIIFTMVLMFDVGFGWFPKIMGVPHFLTLFTALVLIGSFMKEEMF